MTWWAWFPLLFVWVLGHAYLAKAIAGAFVADQHTKVAAFSFVLGMAYLAGGSLNELANVAKLSASLGYVAGLIAVWYLFFKREKVNEQ